MSAEVQLTIDGVTVTVTPGTTIYDAARTHGIPIPTLCHQHNETPVGVCRVCLVEAGGRVLSAACVRPVENGMNVVTGSEKVKSARRTVVELLMADHPSPCARQNQTHDCELEVLAAREGVQKPRFAKRVSPPGRDDSSFVIAVDHEACILCDRCIRGCDDLKQNNVLGRRGKGYQAGVAFDLNTPMGNSSCVSCGECLISCPTGALTNKSVVQTVLPGGEPVKVEELLQLPAFENISGTFLDLNKNAVVRRHFKPGDVVCREGEYGSTAFYILEGKVEVYLSSPIAHVKSQGGATGFFSRVASTLAGRKQDRREEEQDRRSIPIDAPVDLPYDRPIAELGAGDLFGEMTCISLYPRSATVRALTDCTMLEMLRNVLDIMQRNKTVKARLDGNYRRRALEEHLRNVPIFSGLSPGLVDSLSQRAELIRYSAGDVICRQGDPAGAFYLVRIGFVKVSVAHPGGDFVQAYLGKGGYFGEMGLLGEGRRTATCTALDHVEVVRIDAEDFHRLLDGSPGVRADLERVNAQRQRQNRDRLAAADNIPLTKFLEQGLMEAQSLLVLDLERCTRCDKCVHACADAHDGVTRLIREGMRFDRYLVATSCRQCRDPVCMVGCPVGAIRRRASLEVIIEDWCIGCGLCANSCPYGNINMQPVPGAAGAGTARKATSCDLCTEHEEPSCVYACPHDAAHRVEPNTFFQWIATGEKT